MATPSEFILFNCLNTACGKQIRLKRPARSGIYNVTCPHCGEMKKFNLTGLDGGASRPSPSGPSPKPASAAGNSAKEPIELPGDYKTGTEYSERCPHCHAVNLVFKTEKPGHRIVECPSCKGKVSLEIRKPTEVVKPTDLIQPHKGKLIQLRKGWPNRTFHLGEGVTVIGRLDESAMSDISIKGDASISRRSVEITTEKEDNGYTFRLKVCKATNPVLRNGQPLCAGESVSLEFGDILTLGKTRMRFQKDV